MNTEMSSNMQHPLASDHKEVSPDCVGSICRIMNQKNVWLQKNGMSSLLPANSTSEEICPSGGSIGRRFGVDSESASDLSRRIGVSKTVEYWEKVQRTSARPHVDLVPGGNETGTCLTHADTWQQGTCSGVWFSTRFCGFPHFPLTLD